MRLSKRPAAAEGNSLPCGKHADGEGLWPVKRPDGGAQWTFRFTLRGRPREMGLALFATSACANPGSRRGKPGVPYGPVKAPSKPENQDRQALDATGADVDTLDSGEEVPLSFSYTAQSGDGSPATADVEATILGVNDTPTLAAGSGNSVEDGAGSPNGTPPRSLRASQCPVLPGCLNEVRGLIEGSWPLRDFSARLSFFPTGSRWPKCRHRCIPPSFRLARSSCAGTVLAR